MARGAQYYETSTPQLDWVKKFTRSCSRLTGKLDTTTCSQQLFQPNGAALERAEQEAAAHTCSAHCNAACPWPCLCPCPPLLSWHQCTALPRHREEQHRGERPRSFPGASSEPPARNVLLGRAGVRGARSSCPGERDRPLAGGDAKQCCLYLAKRSAKPSQEDSTAQPPLQRN